jgi:hypothetical protein
VCVVSLQFKILWRRIETHAEQYWQFHRRVHRRPGTCRYFTESWKKFTVHATITDEYTDGLVPISNSPRVEKHLRSVPQSPTGIPTVGAITDGNTDGLKPVGILQRVEKNLRFVPHSPTDTLMCHTHQWIHRRLACTPKRTPVKSLVGRHWYRWID